MLKTQAFSVLQLIMALALIIVVTSLCVPSYKRMVVNYRAEHYMQRIAQAISYAQQQAKLRNTTMTLCALTETLTCQQGVIWHNRLAIFIDPNKAYQLNNSSYLLKTLALPTPPATLYFKGLQNQITISANGRLLYQNGRFKYLVNNNDIRELVISPSGRVRIEKESSKTA